MLVSDTCTVINIVPCLIYSIGALNLFQMSCLLLLFEAINLYYWISVNTGGALKPTDIEGLWVHVTCAWFQPKVSFPVEETMEPAMGIMSIPVEYFKKVEIFNWYFHNLHPKS